MAQPAREYRKNSLSIEPCWKRARSDPRIRWEKWRYQVKVAILARENITLDTLPQPKPTHVRLPAEPEYKMANEDSNEQTERDRQTRNNQLKLQWKLKCQKIIEAGILCGERPGALYDQKCPTMRPEVRDCGIIDNEDRCRQISPYIYSFWKHLNGKNGCVCVDDRIAIPNSIKDAYVKEIHATHPGGWGMLDMAVHAW